jgi:prepilin-type N-terminal cleavage/methylation domain-containing protein
MKSVFSSNWKFERSRPKKGLARSSGFTLVEVLIAMVICGIVSVSLYAGLAQCFRSVQSSRDQLRATQILTDKLEVLRLYEWSQITNGYVPATFTENYQTGTNGNLGVAYNGSITISKADVHSSYAGTMRKVTVQVNWTSGATLRQESVETLISQYGIQNFIY